MAASNPDCEDDLELRVRSTPQIDVEAWIGTDSLYADSWLELLPDATGVESLAWSPEDWPDSCNLNLYTDGGMSVGWHADDEALFDALRGAGPVWEQGISNESGSRRRVAAQYDAAEAAAVAASHRAAATRASQTAKGRHGRGTPTAIARWLRVPPVPT